MSALLMLLLLQLIIINKNFYHIIFALQALMTSVPKDAVEAAL